MIKNYTPNRLARLTVVKACLLFVLVGMMALAGCKGTSTELPSTGALSIVNTSPTSATYDVYVDDVKINNGALPFGGQLKYGSYVSGNHGVKIMIAGRAESLLTKGISIAPQTYTTFYVINRPVNFDALVVTDDVSTTSTTNAFIRFVNVSPDAPAMDLKIKDGNSLFTGRAYKTASGFTQLAAGKYTFEIRDANGVVKATLTDISVGANSYYTILARGLMTPANSEENAFSGQVIVHQ
ncbi:DUF4397 domain-containing protein [Pedobacter sp. KR3-3]|uniref:DUF4397 domain-containing protein n=1 Tax=Pedobacter albus TaxID=3113905 RepID=A0ABU7IAU0_9SPHI|nr:DUF4397 domain-containing protein [Pedobacter sp. KR3-3]MEE1946590.1 DUF4397 domain-containing protein [Pedobacter sp. KR3-3]